MNHKRIYENIIANAQRQNRRKHNGTYYEKHHITPKCLGGTNNKDNLVLLTAKEHFVCHKLLTFIYPHNRGISYGFMLTSHKIKISSRDYLFMKSLYKGVEEETKERMKEAWKIRKIPIIAKNKIKNQEMLKLKINHRADKQKETNDKKMIKQLERQKHFSEKPLHSKLYQLI